MDQERPPNREFDEEFLVDSAFLLSGATEEENPSDFARGAKARFLMGSPPTEDNKLLIKKAKQQLLTRLTARGTTMLDVMAQRAGCTEEEFDRLALLRAQYQEHMINLMDNPEVSEGERVTIRDPETHKEYIESFALIPDELNDAITEVARKFLVNQGYV